MTTPTLPTRQTGSIRLNPPQAARPEWQGLFREAVYEDGQPYEHLLDEGPEVIPAG